MSLAVGDWTNSAPQQPVTDFASGQVVWSLARGPSVKFTMPARSPAALISSGLATDVWVYRKGVRWQRCRMLPLEQAWGADGQDVASVSAVGYRSVVEARYIITGPPTFTATEQGTILWNLIQATQATAGGNLGITDGGHATGIVRDRTEYKIGDNLGKLMTDLGQVLDGAWWGVDSGLVFTAKLWDGFATRTDPVVLGQNARSMTRKRARMFANAAGASGSATDTVPHWVAAGSVATDPRGRWEAFDSSHASVIVQATVNGYADGLLDDRTNPGSVWRIELDPGAYFDKGSDYEPGHFVRVVVPPSAVDDLGAAPVDVVCQVTELSVSFDGDEATSVAIAAEEVA